MDNNIDALVINHLSKQYNPHAKKAVDDLNLTCKRGQIVGLLGHNGAGKSTTLKCLTGILPYTEGEVVINGYDLHAEPVKAKHTFGFVSDRHDVFVKMTGDQYLAFMADAYGVTKKERLDKVEELNALFGLGDRIHDPISDYSHGMRQKICMMGSLVHQPLLWILDEPMIGLDPATAAKVSDYMLSYAKAGNCILFSSHNINSVQRICDRAVIIHHGIKTDDFVLSSFAEEHPEEDLESYFLSRTRDGGAQ